MGSSTTKRYLGRLAAVLAVSAATLVAGASPCFACTCIASTDEEHFQRADVVFTGRAINRQDPSAASPQESSIDPITWTFDVENVQKDRAADPQDVVTARSSASCGFTFEVGRRYQVFAYEEDGRLKTGLCSGTRGLEPDTANYAAPAPQTPPPVAPTPSSTTTASPEPTPVVIKTTEPALPSLPADSGRAWFAALGAVLALAVAVVLQYRRRS